MSAFYEIAAPRSQLSCACPEPVVLTETSARALIHAYHRLAGQVDVLAVSPASVMAGEAQYRDGSGISEVWHMTVIAQRRLFGTASDEDEHTEGEAS